MFHFISTIQIKFVKTTCVASDFKENRDLQGSTFHLYVVYRALLLSHSICGHWTPSSTNQFLPLIQKEL